MITINEKMSSFEKKLKKVFRQLKYTKFGTDYYFKNFGFTNLRVKDVIYTVFLVHRVNIGGYHIDEKVTIEIDDKTHSIRSTDDLPELLKKSVEALAVIAYSKLKTLGFQPQRISTSHNLILSVERVFTQSQDSIDLFTDNIKNKYNFQDDIKKAGLKADMSSSKVKVKRL